MPLGKVRDMESGEMCNVLEKSEVPDGPAETLVEMLRAAAAAGWYARLMEGEAQCTGTRRKEEGCR